MPAKHTPAPWKAITVGMDARVMCPDGRYFALVGDTVYHPENIANAHLIAAAPDLLASIKELYEEMVGTGDLRSGALKDAQAAIAKAEGR